MENQSPGMALLRELEGEAIASRKCIEKIPDAKFDFKPHPTSMAMGYLALLVAEIPRWIAVMLTEGDIDFATYRHADIKTTAALVKHFDENMAAARKALQNASPAAMDKIFHLKANGQVLFEQRTGDYIGPTINHWVHHRGQLTVYMRICEIPVPSIYGPSADDKNY